MSTFSRVLLSCHPPYRALATVQGVALDSFNDVVQDFHLEWDAMPNVVGASCTRERRPAAARLFSVHQHCD